MRLIWLTGMPGAGKSTVRRELVRRGEIAYDADEDGFRRCLDRATGAVVEDPGRGHRPPNWHERHWYPIARDRVEGLRRADENDVVFLAGSVPNELDVWDLFDLVLCLIVENETLRQRLESRTDNDFGKDPAVRDAILVGMRPPRWTTGASAPRSSMPPGPSQMSLTTCSLRVELRARSGPYVRPEVAPAIPQTERAPLDRAAWQLTSD